MLATVTDHNPVEYDYARSGIKPLLLSNNQLELHHQISSLLHPVIDDHGKNNTTRTIIC